MAEIEVKPKLQRTGRPFWPWLLALAAAIVLILALPRKAKNGDEGSVSGAYTNTSSNAAYGGWENNLPIVRFEEIDNSNIEVREGDGITVYSIDDAILFGHANATLNSNATPYLQSITRSIDKRFSGKDITVYAAGEGNRSLSARRATVIRDWLQEGGLGNKVSIGEKAAAPRAVLGAPDEKVEIVVE